LIAKTTTRNNNANSGNKFDSMKSEKSHVSLITMKEKQICLFPSLSFFPASVRLPIASKPQTKDIRNTKYKTHNWLTQKNA